MTDTTEERCAWSELLQSECEHCDPSPRTQVKNDAVMLSDLREEIRTELERRATQAVWPLPYVKAAQTPRTGRSTPRWNPGNLAAQIGGDLTLISKMLEALQEEAQSRPNDREFPGGDALVMLGPGADVEAFNYMQLSAIMGRIDEEDIVVPDKRDLEPPLSLLAGWTDIIREERGQPTRLTATIGREIDYIRNSLEWMFSTDENGDMRFLQVDDLANGLSKCRRRLEDILKDGSRAEFTRVNCISPDCETHPRLMKLYTAKVKWDRYRCPACKTTYDMAQYELAKSQNLHSRGLERFISPRDAADATGAPIKTVYSWMKRRKAERLWITPADGNPFAHIWWPDARDLGVERVERLKRQAVRRAVLKAEREAEAKRKAEEKAANDTPDNHSKAS